MTETIAADTGAAGDPASAAAMGPCPPLPRVYLNAGGDRRIARGYPWAFSNEVRMDADAKALAPGTLVTLHRVDGRPLGVGSFNPHALIAFRLFDRDPHAIVDRAWFARRFAGALALRSRLFERPFYRLIHGEADGVPGFVCDRYGDVACCQFNGAGVDALGAEIIAALDDVLAPRVIVLRNDSPARTLEGLSLTTSVVKGELGEGVIEVEEGGLCFFADPLGGQKTGWFFDQRLNRLAVAPLAAGGRVLDVFCHSGGFLLHALAAGATSGVGIDSSESALALAERAARANGLADRCRLRRSEAFAELERLAAAGERYRLVAADPPAFVKSRKDLGSGRRGYRKLARLAAALVEPAGILFVASCSHPVEAAVFGEEVVRGIAAAGRDGRVLAAAGAGPDHPIHLHLPESAYLKALTIQLD
jgi:23S rRNA (cytosine1962-C5)-methyltransferase